ncbi:MAG: hypothetical protein Q7T11_02540, partial [Deltaproteobacteria bacterium]|nr:hypothetical protein [Deltaproteobacteria bacterium]
ERLGVKAEEREAFPLTIDFILPEKPTAEQLLVVVRAIVMQDKETYPEGDATQMSTGEVFRARWYCAGDRDFTLSTLAGWHRRAQGLQSGDTKKLSNRVIVDGWREKIGFKKIELTIISIDLDFVFPDHPTEAQVLAAVGAIIIQDSEAFPDENADLLSQRKFFRQRYYQLGTKILSLANLAAAYRKARGIRGRRAALKLTFGSIIREWKEKLGVEIREKEFFTLSLGFPIPDVLNEFQIIEIIRAIVSQDQHTYPGGDASVLALTAKFKSRRYRVGDRIFTLYLLLTATRKCQGYAPGDTAHLPDSAIIKIWKKVLGVSEEFEGLPIHINFALDTNPTEIQIAGLLRAVIDQDQEFYPEKNPALMSTSPHRYAERKYRAGDSVFSLSTLARWTRTARGLKSYYLQSLPGAVIVREWKEKIFGIIPFNQIDPQALQDFIWKNKLQEVLDLFPDNPAALMEALSFLRPDVFKGKDVIEFVKAYVGLDVERKRGGAAERGKCHGNREGSTSCRC